MSSKRRVAVDLDGVLADTMTACCNILNTKYSTSFEVSSFVHWRAWEIAGITKEQFFQVLDEAWFHWQTIPAVERKLDKEMRNLRKIAEVDIVTGRGSQTVNPAKAWLKEQGIEYNSFVRTESGMDKLKLNYNIFIDDSPELMRALATANNRHGILYTQPWNEATPPTTPHVTRANSWRQIPSLVHELLKEAPSP